jgi:arabinogalactan endo-1,4-beta-galactosidase
VVTTGGLFTFSDAIKVHILEGEHNGEYAWVYDRMLYQDKSNVPYQLAFASICPSK